MEKRPSKKEAMRTGPGGNWHKEQTLRKAAETGLQTIRTRLSIPRCYLHTVSYIARQTPVYMPIKPPNAVNAQLLHLKLYNSFRCPVTLSITLFGAGPIPNTVWLPLAICVLPASAITSATIPRLMAVACKVSNSSSLLTCNATFA
jgi:hypothetical protein